MTAGEIKEYLLLNSDISSLECLCEGLWTLLSFWIIFNQTWLVFMTNLFPTIKVLTENVSFISKFPDSETTEEN